MFLLALASGDQKSALAALSRSKMRMVGDTVAIPYVDRYVPKSYFVKRKTTKIRELKLPFIAEGSRGGACSATAVLPYNDRFDAHRSPDSDCLLLKHSNLANMSANSISDYIKD